MMIHAEKSVKYCTVNQAIFFRGKNHESTYDMCCMHEINLVDKCVKVELQLSHFKMQFRYMRANNF